MNGVSSEQDTENYYKLTMMVILVCERNWNKDINRYRESLHFLQQNFFSYYKFPDNS